MSNVDKYGFSDTGYKSTELIKTTQDDWRPNLPGNKIKVRVSIRKIVDVYVVYICAIGASKYRLELFFETTIQELAEEKYQSWVEAIHSLPNEVDKKMFTDWGLIEKEF